jgi:transcription initiation factor TFIIIB Brf1 subunit/transcription initiation factor TFIIB
MTKCKKELIYKAVDDAFRYYESRGFDGHLTQPQIIEESKQFAKKLVKADLSRHRGIDLVAAIATYLSCESRGSPINLRMAKDSSKTRIKTADLQKARKITGIEPKMTVEDWIDDVVRTLKNKHIISKKQESKIIEKTVLEIPKVQRAFSPRYKTITAVYNAMKSSGIDITQQDMSDIFNVSRPLLIKKRSTSYNDKISKDVNDFLRKNKGTVYKSKDLIEILDLDIKSCTLGNVLSLRTEKLGFQKFQMEGHINVYGFS